MRKVLTPDIMMLIRILRKTGLQSEIAKMTNRLLNRDAGESDIEAIGTDLIVTIVMNLCDAEDELYDLLDSLFEYTQKGADGSIIRNGSVRELGIDELFSKIKIEGKDLFDFFKKALPVAATVPVAQ